MMTRRKKQTEFKEEVLEGPQNKRFENILETNSNSSLAIAKRNEETDHEQFPSPIFNIHIHMPPENGKVSTPMISSIQPVIHLHFDNMVKKLGSEENSSVKSFINDSVNKSAQNLLSVASPKTVNITTNWEESLNSYSNLNSSLENKNRNIKNDQSEIQLEYNCELNNRLSRSRGQSSKSVMKANIQKGLMHTNNMEKKFYTRENDKDFKSIMPSLEKKVNSLVKNHLRRSFSSSNESHRECNNDMNNSVEDCNCNLFSNSMNYENVFKLKQAVVKLEDIYCKTNFKLTSSDDHLKVKPNESFCGLFNSSSEIASSGENKNCQGGYFLRTRAKTKNSVASCSSEMKHKSIVTDEVNKMLHKNCNRKNTHNTSPENGNISNTNSPPRKNFHAEELNKTPQKNIDPKIINKKCEDLGSNLNDMESKTNTTPQKTSFLGNMNNNTFEKDTGRKLKNIGYTEEAISDSDSKPQKNCATNDTEEIESRIDRDSVIAESSCSEELDLQENVIVDEKREKPKNSDEISNRGSHMDSESSDSDENIEIINCSKKFNVLDQTPKTFLASTPRTERNQLDETTKKPFNSHLIVTSESEVSDADVSEECEGDLSENQTQLLLGSSVYKFNNNEQVQALDKISLTSMMEGYNFSEILKKIQDKSLRDKIFNLARRRKPEPELRESGLEKKVQQEQKSITEKRNNNECSMLGSWEKSEQEKEVEEKSENLGEESPGRFTNEDDKSTVEYNGEGLCTSKEAVDGRGSSRERSDCSNALFRYSENELLDKHYESDKSKKTRVKELSLVSSERDEIDVREEMNVWYEGQALESKKTEPLDSTRFQFEYIKKEMRRRDLGIKSGKKNKRKSERKSKKKNPQKMRSPPYETSSSSQKKMKLSEGKSSPNKFKKICLSEESYIPLETSGPTKFAVAPLDKLKPYQKHEAMGFKEKMLFGDRVRRFSSSKKLEVYKMKQKVGGKLS